MNTPHRDATNDLPHTKFLSPLRRRFIITFTLLLFLVGAIGTAATKRAWSDEAWFASPSLNLATRGYMGTDVIETAGTRLDGIRQYTYWVMPLYLVVQAAWYKVVGFGMMQMRLPAALWGLLALFAWYVIVKRLSDIHPGDTARSGAHRSGEALALLTVVLLALDYVFIMGASNGRMDMMCAALGFAGLAAYLHWRERNLPRAIVISHTLVVASGMTHFLGVLPLAALLFLTFYFDYRRLRPQYFLLAAIPYIFAAAGWGLYILQEPQLFIAQFVDNARMGGRMEGFSSPLYGFKLELTDRYLQSFGWGSRSDGHGGIARFKIIILLAYLVAIGGILGVRGLRQHRGVRALLLMTLIYFVTMSVLDGQKLSFYLVHIVPFFTALLAVWLGWCWQRRVVPRPLVAASIVSLLALQFGGVLYRMRVNAHGRSFAPAAAYLKEYAAPDALIMGSAELGFPLGFHSNLVDDVRLGFYTGKRPRYVVVEETYQRSFDLYRKYDPRIADHIARTLERCAIVYDENFYRIYRCE